MMSTTMSLDREECRGVLYLDWRSAPTSLRRWPLSLDLKDGRELAIGSSRERVSRQRRQQAKGCEIGNRRTCSRNTKKPSIGGMRSERWGGPGHTGLMGQGKVSVFYYVMKRHLMVETTGIPWANLRCYVNSSGYWWETAWRGIKGEPKDQLVHS